jgi:hypothetical protein
MNGLLCNIGIVKIGKVLNQNQPKNKKDSEDGAFNRISRVVPARNFAGNGNSFCQKTDNIGHRRGVLPTEKSKLDLQPYQIVAKAL